MPGHERQAADSASSSGVVDVDGDGSFLMNIQELGTVYCENLPVKVILLNNQHLGMVVQWEDRFHAGNRAHTYLGPVDHPEAIDLLRGAGQRVDGDVVFCLASGGPARDRFATTAVGAVAATVTAAAIRDAVS